MIAHMLKQALPDSMVERLKRTKTRWELARTRRFPPLDEDAFSRILREDLGLKAGDVVFVHSSMNRLNLQFPFFRILGLLRDVVTEEGTRVFPTFVGRPACEFLRSGKVFDVRRTPSAMGVLSEFARRQRKTVRSLQPIRSVSASGPAAERLIATHESSPYPFHRRSPFYRLVEMDAKIVGLGVTTRNLTFVHCVDDFLGDNFPVAPYLDERFEVSCVDSEGHDVIVPTYVHDPRKMDHNVPRFVRKHIPDEICKDLTIAGRPFFTARARDLFDVMVERAKKDVTIYSRSVYKR